MRKTSRRRTYEYVEVLVHEYMHVKRFESRGIFSNCKQILLGGSLVWSCVVIFLDLFNCLDFVNAKQGNISHGC